MPGPLSCTTTRKRPSPLVSSVPLASRARSWTSTCSSGRMPASSHASSELSTASLMVVRRALLGLSKPSRWRFLTKNSETEISRCFWPSASAVARRTGAGGAAGGGTSISGAGTTFATGAAALGFGSGLRGASASNSASCGRWTLRPFSAAAFLTGDALPRSRSSPKNLHCSMHAARARRGPAPPPGRRPRASAGVRWGRMPERPLTYGEYLKVPELLTLQKVLSSPAHHDEPLFIIIHQVYELWFKLVLHEVDSAADHLTADRVGEATRLLRRVVEIQRLLVSQVRILETMRPQDFLGFRYHLNPASGFQSVQFRELEFTLGMKDPDLCKRLSCEPHEMARLKRRLEGRTVGDAFDALLVRRGLAHAAATERAGAQAPTKEEDWRLAALVKIYQGPPESVILALCEVLVDIDENLSLWRAHHVQMVERMIGIKRGTGGSEGVGYLRSTLPKRAFPDLWRVRTHLGGAEAY